MGVPLLAIVSSPCTNQPHLLAFPLDVEPITTGMPPSIGQCKNLMPIHRLLAKLVDRFCWAPLTLLIADKGCSWSQGMARSRSGGKSF